MSIDNEQLTVDEGFAHRLTSSEIVIRLVTACSLSTAY
jgi:hypothetical protein